MKRLARKALPWVSALLVIILAGMNLQGAQGTRADFALSPRAAIPYPLSLPKGEIDVNTADMETLCRLHGIGQATAKAILDERETNGDFYYPEDLLSVKGIGQSKLQGFFGQLSY